MRDAQEGRCRHERRQLLHNPGRHPHELRPSTWWHNFQDAPDVILDFLGNLARRRDKSVDIQGEQHKISAVITRSPHLARRVGAHHGGRWVYPTESSFVGERNSQRVGLGYCHALAQRIAKPCSFKAFCASILQSGRKQAATTCAIRARLIGL